MIPIPSYCYSFLSRYRYHEKEQEQEQRSSPTSKLRRPQENGGGWWCSEWPADQAVPDHLWPVRAIQSGPNPARRQRGGDSRLVLVDGALEVLGETFLIGYGSVLQCLRRSNGTKAADDAAQLPILTRASRIFLAPKRTSS